MEKVTEYDLAYICYYSEKIELSAISAGFPPHFLAVFKKMIQELKKENQFNYYKNLSINLLHT